MLLVLGHLTYIHHPGLLSRMMMAISLPLVIFGFAVHCVFAATNGNRTDKLTHLFAVSESKDNEKRSEILWFRWLVLLVVAVVAIKLPRWFEVPYPWASPLSIIITGWIALVITTFGGLWLLQELRQRRYYKLGYCVTRFKEWALYCQTGEFSQENKGLRRAAARCLSKLAKASENPNFRNTSKALKAVARLLRKSLEHPPRTANAARLLRNACSAIASAEPDITDDFSELGPSHQRQARAWNWLASCAKGAAKDFQTCMDSSTETTEEIGSDWFRAKRALENLLKNLRETL
jgi:hypothetical protein